MKATRSIAVWTIAVSLAVMAVTSVWNTWVDDPSDGTVEALEEWGLVSEIADVVVALDDIAFQACLAYVVDYWEGTPVGFGVCREWHPNAAARWDHAIRFGTDAP